MKKRSKEEKREEKEEKKGRKIPLRNYTMTSKGMMHNGDCFKICQGTAAVYKE